MVLLDISADDAIIKELSVSSVYSFQQSMNEPELENWMIEAWDKTLDEVDQLVDNGYSDEEIIEAVLKVPKDRFFVAQWVDDNRGGYFRVTEISMDLLETTLFTQLPREYFSETFIQKMIAKKI